MANSRHHVLSAAVALRRWFGRAIRIDERGNATVELAIVLPTALLILVGIYDFGFATYEVMSLRSAARAGGQYALINPSDAAGLELAVRGSTYVDGDDVEVTYNPYCQCPNGTTVSCSTGTCGSQSFYRLYEVTVTKPYSPIFPYPGIPETMTLTGSAVFRRQ
jgi:hypothetical protein